MLDSLAFARHIAIVVLSHLNESLNLIYIRSTYSHHRRPCKIYQFVLDASPHDWPTLQQRALYCRDFAAAAVIRSDT